MLPGAARAAGVDPLAWLTDVFARVASTPQSQLEVLPSDWKGLNQPAAAPQPYRSARWSPRQGAYRVLTIEAMAKSSPGLPSCASTEPGTPFKHSDFAHEPVVVRTTWLDGYPRYLALLRINP